MKIGTYLFQFSEKTKKNNLYLCILHFKMRSKHICINNDWFV